MRGITQFSFVILVVFSCRSVAWTSPSDVATLAEEAIANTNASAASLRARPNDPRVRDAYLLSLDNLALARQAIEEEFQKGSIDRRARTRLLVRLARLLDADPTGDFGSAIEVALEENQDTERFVPPPIPGQVSENKNSGANETPTFPKPIATNGSTVVFLTRDLFPNSTAHPDPATSEKRSQNGRQKLTLSRGYNAPSLSTSRPLGSVLDTSAVEVFSDGSMKDLLASALDEARVASAVAKPPRAAGRVTKPLAPTLSPGLSSLAAGLSGKVARSNASLGGIEPEFLSLTVAAPQARNSFSLWWFALGIPPILILAWRSKRSNSATTAKN
ncbi:MAG: hypothetical protein KDD51_15805 [Bdellovibrionales bacterium]|nr:hypothetical protein [Bdellovibrionales bacterium]